ncbi:helix-turn-helix domain-containing protein [Pontibacter vulgaris]|uniref:helix-turn-helix domain-containing protein n=1 Tax=Pontibacter vulgaris TaxID=2905679 RepID=UPI001FA8178C|nr:helix-turn-helix domain-containing protein [Pontibacter vulgaris]
MEQNQISIQLLSEQAIKQIVQGVTEHLKFVTTQVQPSTAPEAEAPISIDEACKLLRISRVTLTNWRHQGLIKGHSIGRRVYLFKSEILRVIEQPRFKRGRA